MKGIIPMTSIPEIYGRMVFGDSVMKERLTEDAYNSLKKTIQTGKTIDVSIANEVAEAMKNWACEMGATHYTHWFQPLTNVTAEKHDSFISPTGRDKVVMEFSGKELIKGESDASSFPSGGLRETCSARGYTAWDPSSYAFIKDNTLYIPTVFFSYGGESLDAKTPLLRSMDAISEQGLRVLSALGQTDASRVLTSVGAEQEYFLVSKDFYDKREDLIYTGRTLFGAPAPKGEELEDHYFGPLKSKVASYMSELDRELWELGISSKTKHNEVAPSQHELAPIYAPTSVALDHNMLIMDAMKRVAQRHSMVALLHEKPYAGISGSGKHNNWSISTDTGENLLSPGKNPASNIRFLLFLSAVIRAVDEYQDLLRFSVATPGNDHRLGANEAPPAIVSIFLGDELEAIVESIVGNTDYTEKARVKTDIGVPSVPTFRYDSTDRNRTSPFAFTGNKFEFRMLGASQNIAMPNIVLNTAVAQVLSSFADKLETAEDVQTTAKDLIKEALTNHRRIIFNGNGYSEEWIAEAERRGLLNLKTSVDAYPYLLAPKNINLFEQMGVMNEAELRARHAVLFETYCKTIHIEARTMTDIVNKKIIPAVERYICELSNTAKLKREVCGDGVISLERELILKLTELCEGIHSSAQRLKDLTVQAKSQSNTRASAEYYRDLVCPEMARLRLTVDAAEQITPAGLWPLPSYGDMTYKQ